MDTVVPDTVVASSKMSNPISTLASSLHETITTYIGTSLPQYIKNILYSRLDDEASIDNIDKEINESVKLHIKLLQKGLGKSLQKWKQENKAAEKEESTPWSAPELMEVESVVIAASQEEEKAVSEVIEQNAISQKVIVQKAISQEEEKAETKTIADKDKDQTTEHVTEDDYDDSQDLDWEKTSSDEEQEERDLSDDAYENTESSSSESDSESEEEESKKVSTVATLDPAEGRVKSLHQRSLHDLNNTWVDSLNIVEYQVYGFKASYCGWGNAYKMRMELRDSIARLTAIETEFSAFIDREEAIYDRREAAKKEEREKKKEKKAKKLEKRMQLPAYWIGHLF